MGVGERDQRDSSYLMVFSNYTLVGLLLAQVLIVQSLGCVRLCDPMGCSTPGFPVLHRLPEFAQTHVH